MTELVSLWLPIVVSAVVVWIASVILCMVMPHHKRDQIPLQNEEAFVEFVRSQGMAPGNYAFPNWRDSRAMKDPAFMAKLDRGPVGTLSVWQVPMKMGPKLVGMFLVCLVVSAMIAYLASFTVEPHANFQRVMRITGTAGVLAYSFAFIPSAIWFEAYARTIAAYVVDGVVYGLATGAVFAWLWP